MPITELRFRNKTQVPDSYAMKIVNKDGRVPLKTGHTYKDHLIPVQFRVGASIRENGMVDAYVVCKCKAGNQRSYFLKTGSPHVVIPMAAKMAAHDASEVEKGEVPFGWFRYWTNLKPDYPKTCT